MNLPPRLDATATQQGLAWLARPYDFLRECAEELGDAFTLDLGTHGTYVMLSHPKAVREVFTGDATMLHAGKGNMVLQAFLGRHSLLLLEEERHLGERRMLLPAFHGARIAEHTELMHQLAAGRINRWEPGQAIDVQHVMQELTLEVILRVVFGLSEGAALHELRARLQDFLNDPKFNLALIGQLEADLGESESWRAFRDEFQQVRELLDAQVARRRAAMEGEGEGAQPSDVLGMMLLARREDGSALSDEELRDELVTLVVTGYETTATALAWALYWLAQEPKVRAELVSLMRRLPLQEALAHPALDAFCKEVLRIHPVIPVVARQVQDTVEVAGYTLPPGITVAPCIYLTHHRPDLYPDPDEFRPARFMERRYGPYEYLPFGGGARRCIGMPLALWEMKVVLAALLPRAELELSEPGRRVRPVRRSVTVAPMGGPRMRLRQVTPF
jgi:cytochrome P450 family 110